MQELDVRNVMKSYRIKIGKTQQEVAEMLGITRLTLSTYEKHPGKIPLYMFGKLIDIYGEDFKNYFFTQKLYKV